MWEKLPHVNAEDVEEERRIAYVGVTRGRYRPIQAVGHGAAEVRLRPKHAARCGIPDPMLLGRQACCSWPALWDGLNNLELSDEENTYKETLRCTIPVYAPC
jgi:hypothetical protein